MRSARTFVTVGMMVSLSTASARAQPVSSATAGVHAELARRGVGHRVRLVEFDGDERGTILALDETSVTLKTTEGVPTQVQLSDIKAVKGAGLSRTSKIVIFVVVLAVLAGVAGGFRD